MKKDAENGDEGCQEMERMILNVMKRDGESAEEKNGESVKK